MNATEQMKHKLKILAGLPPNSPTDSELHDIIQHIEQIASQRTPTEDDWREVTTQLVPHAGTYKYAGEDMSDLNYLLQLIRDRR